MSLTIQITNFSDTELSLWFKNSGITFNETLENTPSDKLQPHSGMTKMAASQNTVTWLGIDIYSIQCGYHGGDLYFGIQCKENAQVLGIGASPEYSVSDGKGGWTKMDGSNPYVWTTPTLIATATPTITHENITVDVIVKNNKS